MANLTYALPLPVFNGAGAAVDVSAMGRDKTLYVNGTFPGAAISVEVSNDGGTTYFPIANFQGDAQPEVVVPVAAQWMRTRVSGRVAGVAFTASLSVAGNDNGGLFATLALPAFNGVGVATDVSLHGSFSTFIVTGLFPGAGIEIQASPDNVNWKTIASFAGRGGKVSLDEISDWYRVKVSGRTTGAPFSAAVALGSINDPITSGGAGGGTQYVFVYRQGEPAPADNVYATWAAAYAAASAVEGQRVIQIDGTLGACAITAGAYDLTDIRLVGLPGISPGLEPGTQLDVNDLVTFANNSLTWLEGVNLKWNGTDAPVIIYDDSNATLRMDSSSIITANGNAMPFAQVDAHLLVELYDSVLGEGNETVFNVTGAGNLEVNLWSGARILGVAAAGLGQTSLNVRAMDTQFITQNTSSNGIDLFTELYWASEDLDSTDSPIAAESQILYDVNSTNAPTIFNLPAQGAGDTTFHTYYVRENGNNWVENLVVTPQGGDTIEGFSTFTLRNRGQALQISAGDNDGDWKIVSKTPGYSEINYAAVTWQNDNELVSGFNVSAGAVVQTANPGVFQITFDEAVLAGWQMVAAVCPPAGTPRVHGATQIANNILEVRFYDPTTGALANPEADQNVMVTVTQVPTVPIP